MGWLLVEECEVRIDAPYVVQYVVLNTVLYIGIINDVDRPND